MTQTEATTMATQLLETYGKLGFEISMPDEESYVLMRRTLLDMGRESGPDGEFFIVKVSPKDQAADTTTERGSIEQVG